MTYIDEIFDAIKAELPDIDPLLLPLYALLALSSPGFTTMTEVHDAWAIWRHQTQPDHRSIVPFEELTEEVQALDWIYMKKVQRVGETVREAYVRRSTPVKG